MSVFEKVVEIAPDVLESNRKTYAGVGEDYTCDAGRFFGEGCEAKPTCLHHRRDEDLRAEDGRWLAGGIRNRHLCRRHAEGAATAAGVKIGGAS